MLQDKKIKVLHIIPPVQYGGGESVVKDIILNTKSEVYSEVLLLCRSKKYEIKLLESNIIFNSFNFKELLPNSNIINFLHLFFKIFFSLKFTKIKTIKYDILHCHGFPSVLIGLLCKIHNKNIKIIYTHHQQVFESNFLIVTLFRYIYIKFDYITFVSNSIAHNFCSKFKINRDTTVIYNPVSNTFYNYDTFIKNINLNDLKLVYLSRFSKQKAHLELIQFFLNEKEILINNKIVIYFYGDGSEMESCLKLVNDNSLQNNFKFLGFVDQNQISEEINNYDIAIFPSIYEGFGVAVAECIASGLPVIYNKVNETLVEIVNDAGWGIDLDKMPSFIKGLNIEELNQKISNCKIQRLKFKQEIISKQYIKLYKHLI
jgi:glycosyltransferase involved in cell wall biosynthesis